MEIKRETEKAVLVTVKIELCNIEREVSRDVWFPKSQLDKDGNPNEWIVARKWEELRDELEARHGYGLGILLTSIGGVSWI